MKQEVGDSLSIIAYHIRSDGWHNTDGNGRKSFYNVLGTPTLHCDGKELAWNGGANYNYNGFRSEFDRLKEIPPGVEIALTGVYDQNTGEGSVTATVKNITSSGISGKIHFAICQSDTPFVWYDATELHHIERKMLPDYNGTSVSIAADESTDVTESFTVQSSWQRDNCYVVAFVQNSSKEIAQAIECDLLDLSPTKVIPGGKDKELGNTERNLFTMGPNPVNNILRITFFRKAVNIVIIDSKGRLKKTVIAKGQNMTIPVSELGSGVYFCVIKEKGRIQKRKFIKF